MFSHVMFGARDLARMGAFYDAVLAPLGLRRRWEGSDDGGPPGVGWAAPGTRVPTFFVQEPWDRTPASAGNGCMAAFLAPSQEAVRAAHAAGLAAGGADEGAPGERPRYGRGYYGAYLRDPEGNKLHVVHRGDLEGAG
ncbi:MAG: VOC family protein [Acetobacteraceae bacterium]|nr:VOC family protein [Acetobacteraceae bacterium]